MARHSNIAFGPKGAFVIFPEVIARHITADLELGLYAIDVPADLPSLSDKSNRDHDADWPMMNVQKRCLHVLKRDPNLEPQRHRLNAATVMCRASLKGSTFEIDALVYPKPHMPNAANSDTQTIQRCSVKAALRSADAQSCRDVDVLRATRSTVEAGNSDNTFVGIIGGVTVFMLEPNLLGESHKANGPAAIYALFPSARSPFRTGLVGLQVPAEVKLWQTSKDLSSAFMYEVYLDTLNGTLFFLLGDSLCVAEY